MDLPSWERIIAYVLGAGDSAPGLDSEPYEVYQFGARFVSCLLGQAFIAAQYDTQLLREVLGPSTDLLIWILKTPDAKHTSGMRPLQIPSCFSRLYGSVVASVVGPRLEAELSTHQSAIAGGNCGTNIKKNLPSFAVAATITCAPHGTVA